MFSEQLAKIANDPYARYSGEIRKIVSHGLFTLKGECSSAARNGRRQHETFLMGFHGIDYCDMPLDFGNIHFLSPLRDIPREDMSFVLEKVKEEIEKSLKKEGFKNIRVSTIVGKAYYDPIYILGHKTRFKDLSNPHYSQKIQISVAW